MGNRWAIAGQWVTVIAILLSGVSLAHTDNDDSAQAAAELGPEAQAVVATLDAFASAYESTNIEAIHQLTLADDRFSHFEGTFADWGWDSYAGHLAEEMPAFSETRYALTNIRPEVDGAMAFSTFDWSMDVVILSEQFEGGRHPVSMQGIGTAVLVKSGTDWKLRHLHTARAKAPAAAATR